MATAWSAPSVSSVSSTPVSRTARSMPSRTCSIWIRLAFCAAISASSRASPPGRSRRRVNSRTRRPAAVSWRAASADDQRQVDVAAGQDRHRRAGGRGLHRAGHQGGHAHGAGALDQQLRALEQEHHRLGDVLLAHGHQVAQVLFEQRAGDLAVALDRDAVGDGLQRVGRADADHLHAGQARAPSPEASPPPPTGTTTRARSGTSSASSRPTPAWPAITSQSS